MSVQREGHDSLDMSTVTSLAVRLADANDILVVLSRGIAQRQIFADVGGW